MKCAAGVRAKCEQNRRVKSESRRGYVHASVAATMATGNKTVVKGKGRRRAQVHAGSPCDAG